MVAKFSIFQLGFDYDFEKGKAEVITVALYVADDLLTFDTYAEAEKYLMALDNIGFYQIQKIFFHERTT